MITDVTGIKLTPGNGGADCLGNGEHYDKNGNLIECCCDECSWFMCCFTEHSDGFCTDCINKTCPYREN